MTLVFHAKSSWLGRFFPKWHFFLTFFQFFQFFFFKNFVLHVIRSCYMVLRGCVIYFMVKLNIPGCAANAWPEKRGHMTLTYWPFKATKFDWNVQTLTFSEWNTQSVKPLMELMAASFFGAASTATLPKQKPWSCRCTGCMNWYKGLRVQTRMSLEINLFIKNQWQELIVFTCVLITKR